MTTSRPCEGDYVILALKPPLNPGSGETASIDSPSPRSSHCVAYIREILDYPEETAVSFKCRIRLLSPALPVRNEMDGTMPHMFTSVHCQAGDSQSSQSENTTEEMRPPLQPSKPFPWPEAYHHSALGNVTVRLFFDPAGQYGAKKKTTISSDEMFEHDFHVQEDEDDRRGLRKVNWDASMMESLHRSDAEGSAFEFDEQPVQKSTGIDDLTDELMNSETNLGVPVELSSAWDMDDDGDENDGLLAVQVMSYDLSTMELPDPELVLF